MVIGQMETAQWILTAGISLMVAWFVRHIVTRPRNLPPGPTGIPFIGVSLKLFRADPLTLFSSWADEYGDIVSFRVGPKVMILLSSYEAVSEAFRHPDLNNRPKSQIMKEISGAGENGVLCSQGETWKEQRKFIHSVFRRLGVGKRSYEETVAREMTQLGDVIEGKGGSPFNPSVPFGQAVANIICTIVFGTQYKYSDKDFKQIVDLMNRNMNLFGRGAWIFFLPLPGISKIPLPNIQAIVSNTREMNEFIRVRVKNHEMTLDRDHPRDFIDRYLVMMNETKGTDSTFNPLNLESAIKDLFFAGTETTTTSLKWCILFMMAYPDIQSRVQDELDHVIGRERLPMLDDRKNLPYTCAVLMEVQRKGSITPLGLPHIAAAETEIRGYTIPKGASITPNIYKVLNSEDLWDDPEAFKPERFIDENGRLVNREELIFFSTGRRSCLGEQLARMETFLGFSILLQKFRFHKPDASPPLSFAGVLGGTRDTVPYLTRAVSRV